MATATATFSEGSVPPPPKKGGGEEEIKEGGEGEEAGLFPNLARCSLHPCERLDVGGVLSL